MEYIAHVLILAGVYSILTLSLNLMVGFTGLPALGHAAFFAVGAYASSLLALQLGVSPWAGLVIGALVAALLGVIVAIPTLRLKGDYLALATFSFGLIAYSVAKNWISLTRGPFGLPGIPHYSIFGWTLSSPIEHLPLVILLVLITAVVIGRIAKSPFGRILTSIREDELAAEALGKNVAKYKVLVFIVGAFFAGIAGSLYAHYTTYIDPSSFTVLESITILLMVIFGGMGSIPGSILGATVLIVFPEILRFLGLPSAVAASVRQMLYGLLLVLLMLRHPQGLMGYYRIR